MASAGVKHKQVLVVPEQQAASSQILEHGYDSGAGYSGEYDHGFDSGKGSTGAELSSLAHSSAIQAKNAVQSQHTAGSQAAFGVKNSLATAAFGVRQISINIILQRGVLKLLFNIINDDSFLHFRPLKLPKLLSSVNKPSSKT